MISPRQAQAKVTCAAVGDRVEGARVKRDPYGIVEPPASSLTSAPTIHGALAGHPA